MLANAGLSTGGRRARTADSRQRSVGLKGWDGVMDNNGVNGRKKQKFGGADCVDWCGLVWIGVDWCGLVWIGVDWCGLEDAVNEPHKALRITPYHLAKTLVDSPPESDDPIETRIEKDQTSCGLCVRFLWCFKFLCFLPSLIVSKLCFGAVSSSFIIFAMFLWSSWSLTAFSTVTT